MDRFWIYIGACALSLVIGTTLHYYGPPELTGAHMSGSTSITNLPEESIPGSVAFTVIAEGTYAEDIADRKNFAVTSDTEFARLWRMAYGDTAPPRPSVDFDAYQVIGVFMGEQGTGGHAIRVARIVDDKNTRMIFVTLQQPAESCMTTQALTRPFQFVRVPLSALTLARTDLEAITTCS